MRFGVDSVDLKLFTGRAHPELAQRIADYLKIGLGKLHVGDFPDGETIARIEENVRGCDVFVVQPTCPPVNHNLMELLIIIDSLKRASAGRITAVIPYYGYARQDRKDVGRVPITAKLVANLIERAGAHRVLTVDLHSGAIQGFFDIPVDHLQAAPVLADHIMSLGLPMDEVVIVAPDEGAVKRILPFLARVAARLSGQPLSRTMLASNLAPEQDMGAPGFAIIDKRRSGGMSTRQAHFIGSSVEGKIAVLIDDMITTGGSIVGAATVAHEHGARQVYAACTHPVLCGNAKEKLAAAHIDHLIVCDTIPVDRSKWLPNMEMLTLAHLLGEAIKRIHKNESVSGLFDLQMEPQLIS